MNLKRVLLFILSLTLLTLIITACDGDRNNTSSGTDLSHVTSSEIDISDESHDNTISDVSDISNVSSDISDNVSNTISDTLSDVSDVTSGDQTSGALSAPYIKIIDSSKFMLKVNMPLKIGDSISYDETIYYYKSGNYVIVRKEYGNTTRTVVMGDVFYTFMPELETTIKSSISDLVAPNIPKLKNLVHISDGVDTVNGILYDLEEFRDTDGNTVTFMYKGTILKRMRCYVPSMDSYEEFDVTIQSTYDENVFELPSNYELVDMT
ncbi:MAG: hypothetical protein A2Y17_05660 [Clostridiales bacterium GWF2_38_85]|nr:MAG: hypothetical protein A2Y17_05660 [Clostridiales bacterium GWF2_38_85]HBL84032.1 hypothetical protein [Clostridiales bacterium]